MMNNKKWVFLVLTSFTIMSMIVIAINFIVDPFQQYRVSDWYKVTAKKQRYVTPGLAKNAYYETLVIGSSMVENFDMEDIDNALNTKSLNLAMAGMSTHEMHHLLNTVIAHNSDLSQIIISLDTYELSGKPDRFRNNGLPLYLFDCFILNDIKYLLDIQTLKYSIRALTKEINQKADLNRLWNWKGDIEYSKKAVSNSYRSGKFNTYFALEDYKFDVLKESFLVNIYPYIRDNPDVSFVIFYPPYSYVAYRDMMSKGWLEDVYIFKKYLYELGFDNLRIYDFQCVSSITENLSLYKDITHYSPKINKYIISSIKSGEHQVNAGNIDQCLKQFKESASKGLPSDFL